MCPTSFLWKSFGFLVVVVHAQSCLTLCDAMDYSPPGSSAHGLSRQEHWSGLPGPPPGDLSDPGSEPGPPALAGRFLTTAPPGKSRAPPQVQNSKFNQRNDKIQKAKENKISCPLKKEKMMEKQETSFGLVWWDRCIDVMLWISLFRSRVGHLDGT